MEVTQTTVILSLMVKKNPRPGLISLPSHASLPESAHGAGGGTAGERALGLELGTQARVPGGTHPWLYDNRSEAHQG